MNAQDLEYGGFWPRVGASLSKQGWHDKLAGTLVVRSK